MISLDSTALRKRAVPILICSVALLLTIISLFRINTNRNENTRELSSNISGSRKTNGMIHKENIDTADKYRYPRKLNDNSPFAYLKESLESTVEGRNILENWDNEGVVSRTTQCEHLIKAIYHEDPTWSNQPAYENFADAKDYVSFSALEAERIRIYNYCFLFGNVDPKNIFSHKKFDYDVKTNATDFQNRIFPFIRIPMKKELLLPEVTNLSTMESIRLEIPESVSTKEFNDNFFANWIKMSKGKGIVTTLNENVHSGYFFKQLAILQHLNNTLPIQIVTHEHEISDKFKLKLSQMGKETNQELILITYTNLLAEKNMKSMKSFRNKFLACLFNTFEEYIILDHDVVPFAKPESFFSMEEYTSSGNYLFKYGEIAQKIEDKAIDILNVFEPTLDEVKLLKTSLVTTFLDHDIATAEGMAMDLLSQNYKHVIESGLVVSNKANGYAGILMGLSMCLNDKLSKIYHGDKEFFWLGPLFAGQTFAIEPSGAALMGYPIKHYDEKERYTSTSLCDTHIAHERKGELLWTNGGLDAYKEVEGIDYTKQERPRMKLNGYMIPIRNKDNWKEKKMDYGIAFCATAVEPGSRTPPHGIVRWLGEGTFNELDRMSRIWHAAEI